MLRKLLGEPEFPRQPRHAGLSYPDDPVELRALVREHLIEGERTACAVIVPHADMRLVAPVVAAGIGALRPASRVVVVGPSLKIPFRGLAVPDADGWTTPIGSFRIDTKCYDRIGKLGTVRNVDVAFDPEPAIELVLPWLFETHPKAEIVPLLCGDASTEEVLDVLYTLASDETVLVITSDFAVDDRLEAIDARDRSSLETIERLAGAELARGDVTARVPIAALTALASKRDWVAKTLVRRTSADLGAEDSLAAGFAAVAFVER